MWGWEAPARRQVTALWLVHGREAGSHRGTGVGRGIIGGMAVAVCWRMVRRLLAGFDFAGALHRRWAVTGAVAIGAVRRYR